MFLRPIRRTAQVALLVFVTAGSAWAQFSRLTGIVKDDRGEPVKGATVVAQNGDRGPTSFTATTDEKGRFSMIGLHSGVWDVEVQAPGYAGQRGPLTVRQSVAANPPGLFVLKKIVAPPSVLGTISAKDVQAALEPADRLYDSQRWDEAIAAYRAVLAQAPALSAINLQIAAAYRNKGEFDKAIATYNELLKVDPGSSAARVGIAMMDLAKGDSQAAEQALEAAAREPGATREVFYGLAEMKMSRSQPDEAAKAYSRASEIDPSWGKPVFALGRLAMTTGDTAGALKYFEKVVAIDPTSPEGAQAKTTLEQTRK